MKTKIKKIEDNNNNMRKSYFQKFYVIFENKRLARNFFNLKDFKYSILPTKKENYVFFCIWKHDTIETTDEIFINIYFNNHLNKIKTAIKKIDQTAPIFAIDETQIVNN